MVFYKIKIKNLKYSKSYLKNNYLLILLKVELVFFTYFVSNSKNNSIILCSKQYIFGHKTKIEKQDNIIDTR